MISTRLHGAVDYTVSALFGGLALGSRLPWPVRKLLGAAGAYHASYSLLTDYEAGLRPAITMRQHLLLDGLGAGALVARGVLMRRQQAGTRLFLVAAGLAESAIIASSCLTSRSRAEADAGLAGPILRTDGLSPNQIAEPPLDTLKPVTTDVFIVDSTMAGPLGLLLPIRMTIIRLPGGDLLLHSPTRLAAGLRSSLDQLGRVRHLVAPNSVHWTFLEQWQNAYPDAVTWAAPNLRARAQVRRRGVRLDHDLDEAAPPEWNGIELVVVPGGLGFREVAFFHRPSRTLVLTDLVLNLQPEQVPAALRPLAKLLGIVEASGQPPIYLRAVLNLRRREAGRAAARLIALHPDRVVFAHGPWFACNGTEALRRALRWLLPETETTALSC